MGKQPRNLRQQDYHPVRGRGRWPVAWALGAVLLLSLLPLSALGREGQLQVVVVDRETGKTIPARMHLRGANNRPRKIPGVPFWFDHFVFPGELTLHLPKGGFTFDLERGLEYLTRSGHFTMNDASDDVKQIDLQRFVEMAAEGWWSGDLDVRRAPAEIELLMSAEDVHVVPLTTWWNAHEGWPEGKLPKEPLVAFDDHRCAQLLGGSLTHAGATVSLFGLPRPMSLDEKPAEYPALATVLEAARKHDGVWVDLTRPYWWDMPMLVANGLVDSIQVLHGQICRDRGLEMEDSARPNERPYPGAWGTALWSQEIYFRLLECGLRLPPTAGSGSGVSPSPVGYNRLYVNVEEPFSYEQWWENLRVGQVVLTNGPLLKPSVEGQPPGFVFHAPEGKTLELEIGLTLWCREPPDAKESIHYLEILQNGKVFKQIPFEEYSKSGRLPKVRFDQSGWFLVRAVTDVQKTYRFAMTGPYFVEIGPRPRISKAAAQFFVDWVHQRARQLKLDDPAQRSEVMAYHRKARDFWEKILAEANAD